MKSIVSLVILLFCISCYSQNNNGSVKGKIVNINNNDPVPYATISVIGTSLGAISDTSGNFFIKGIAPGYVRLKVSSVGFKPDVTNNIFVTNARPVETEISLEEESTQVGEVVVKGSAIMRNDESPVSLQALSSAEIEKSPGSNRDISKVMQVLPGVSSTPAYRNDIIVRGGGTSENRFYLDGIEIPTINHFSTQGASGGPVGIINLDFIQDVNFYSGDFPSNREDALSSVIEFKQIDGNKDKIKFKGDIGATDIGVSFDGPITKNSTFLFSARRSYLQIEFAALQLPFLPTYNDMQTKVKVKINEKNIISFIALGAYDISKLNISANQTEDERYILGYLPVIEEYSYTVGAIYKHFEDNSNQTLTVSRNYLYNYNYKYLDNNTDSTKILDYRSYEADNRARFENNLSIASMIKLNMGLNFDVAQYYNSSFASTASYGFVSNISFLKYGFFLQGSTRIFDKKLGISAGLRLDANNCDNAMSNLANQISPHISFSWSLTDDFFINANAGRYFEIPPYTSLGYENQSGTLVNKQNNIQYIQCDHLVGGIEYHPNENSKLSLEGFYKHYLHYPFSVADSVAIASEGADYGVFGNEEVLSTGIGRTYGGELFYQSKGMKNNSLLISITLVRSEFENLHGTYIPTAWDNKIIFNITDTRSLPRNWRAGFKWRYVGGAPYTPYNIPYSSIITNWNAQGRGYPDYSKFNQDRLQGFQELDIRIDKEYFFRKWTLNFYLDIQNVYDFQAQQPDLLVIDESDPIKDASHYNLKLISNNAGTIIPSIGAFFIF